MNTKWMMIAAVLTAGCADVASTPEAPGTPFATPEVAPTVRDDRADYLAQPKEHLVDLNVHVAVDCEEPSMIERRDLGNKVVGQPVVTEVFGPDGCLDERWVNAWDGELKLSTFYDFFDPNLGRYAYVEPRSYTEEFTYDDQGRVLTVRSAGEDGEVYYEVTYRYDEAGNTVETTRLNSPYHPENSAREDTTYRETWTYDADGRVLEYLAHYNGEISSGQRFVYDGDGNELEFWQRTGEQERLVRQRTYEDGRVEKLETFSPSGTLESETDYAYRSDGTLERETQRHHTGRWLGRTFFDAQERQIGFEQDTHMDGTVNYRTEQRFDATGNLILERTERDYDSAGRPLHWSETRREYDHQNRLLRAWHSPSWRDNVVVRSSYTYQGTGYVVVNEELNGNGEPNGTVFRARYLDGDRLAWERRDNDRDGDAEGLLVNRWDGERQLERLQDYDGDGTLDSIEQWHYDAAGQLTDHMIDHDADGVADARTLHRR